MPQPPIHERDLIVGLQKGLAIIQLFTEETPRLSVADVLERVPGCRREVVRWTSEEIEDGPEAFDVDLFSRDARRRALERLAAELRALEPAA